MVKHYFLYRCMYIRRYGLVDVCVDKISQNVFVYYLFLRDNIYIVVYGIVQATMLILLLFLFVTYCTAYRELGEYNSRSKSYS